MTGRKHDSELIRVNGNKHNLSMKIKHGQAFSFNITIIKNKKKERKKDAYDTGMTRNYNTKS